MINGHFDKILLTVLILLFAICAFRGFQVGSVGLETFGSDTTKLFAGALLTLITGSVIKKAATAIQPGTPPPTSSTEEKQNDPK